MKDRNLVWFTLGMFAALAVVGAGNMSLRNDGIEFPDGSIQMTAATSAGQRSYYLTALAYDGLGALTACDPGYHMASLYEILDPSNLRYAFDLPAALTRDDSGQGPPSDAQGWIRTGETTPVPAEAEAGEANCDVWTTNLGTVNGSRMELEDKWANIPTVAELGPWDLNVAACDDLSTGVWCIAD